MEKRKEIDTFKDFGNFVSTIVFTASKIWKNLNPQTWVFWAVKEREETALIYQIWKCAYLF